jgi:hypothetical protein
MLNTSESRQGAEAMSPLVGVESVGDLTLPMVAVADPQLACPDGPPVVDGDIREPCLW